MIALYKPYMPESLPELDAIIHSGSLAYGNWGKKFEQALANYIGNEKVITTNSYGSSMLTLITTLGLLPGDEVIASPMSCLASNQPFITQGLKVVWADIDPNTGTLDPDSVEEKITSKTKAIFHNHYCGYLGYINEINALGKKNGLYVIDDAIEAFGSEYENKKIGNVGTDATVFSFQMVRMPNTIDGGAITFNSEDFYEKAKLVRDYGVNRSGFRDSNGEINKNCDITLPGYGALMSEVNSYIGVKQMDEIDKLIYKQRENAAGWNSWLKDNYPEMKILKPLENTVPNYWVYGLFADNKLEAIRHFREKGFYASGVHLNNNEYSVFGKKQRLKGVESFYSRFFAIPSGWWVNL